MRPHVYTHIRTTVFLYVYCVLLTLWIPADPAAKGNVCNSEAARLKHERASTSQQHYAEQIEKSKHEPATLCWCWKLIDGCGNCSAVVFGDVGVRFCGNWLWLIFHRDVCPSRRLRPVR